MKESVLFSRELNFRKCKLTLGCARRGGCDSPQGFCHNFPATNYNLHVHLPVSVAVCKSLTHIFTTGLVSIGRYGCEI